MCAGAIVQSRISRVVFGAKDPKGGAVSSLYEILSDPRLNHRPEITSGVEAEVCGEMLTNFFRRLREVKSK
jgi:tRNA(adenine34) deaminase